jgi:hypothetical protein
MVWLILTLSFLLDVHFVPLLLGSLFKLAKFPVVSERDKNFFTNRIANI